MAAPYALFAFSMTNAPDFVTFHEVATAADSGYAMPPDVAPWHHWTDEVVPAAYYEADAHFVLGQNYPNPHHGETTVPFMLHTNADVHLDLLDQLGRKMAGVARKGCSAGPQSIKINLEGLGLPSGDYIYRLQVSSMLGISHQAKRMTIE